MKKIKNPTKLSLSTETIRDLEANAISLASGAALGTVFSLFTGVCKGCTTGCASQGDRLCN